MISEIRQATVSVSNLAVTRQFYENVLDYVVHAEGPVSGTAFRQLWSLPGKMTGEVLVMGPQDANSGMLRLVQFDTPGKLYWGDYSRKNDYGHYALNSRVPDIHTAAEAITENGGRLKSEPTQWTVTPTLSAWDSMSYDPDNIMLDVFELETGPGSELSDYDGRPSSLQTVAIHAGDACRSARFYAALGYRPMYNKLLENMESFLHLPTGTAMHNINMMMPDQPGIGRVEIAQHVGWPGRSLRDQAVPPALGILGISMETDDLGSTEELLRSIGAEYAGERVETSMPGLGNIAARAYYGPDDERLEFFQRL